jgi:hypothetical protein
MEEELDGQDRQRPRRKTELRYGLGHSRQASADDAFSASKASLLDCV